MCDLSPSTTDNISFVQRRPNFSRHVPRRSLSLSPIYLTRRRKFSTVDSANIVDEILGRARESICSPPICFRSARDTLNRDTKTFERRISRFYQRVELNNPLKRREKDRIDERTNERNSPLPDECKLYQNAALPFLGCR